MSPFTKQIVFIFVATKKIFMNEIEIIKKFQNWEKEIFSKLYDEYIDKIYKFVYLKTYQKEISEDLTSEIFLKAVKNLEKFDIEKKDTSFKSWIYRIARNTVIDFYRTKKEEVSIENALEKWEEINFWKDIDNKDKIKEILEFLETLKKEHKEILIMRLWENLSFKEIAEITWKSEDNCKKIVSRTLVKVNQNVTFLITLLVFS